MFEQLRLFQPGVSAIEPSVQQRADYLRGHWRVMVCPYRPVAQSFWRGRGYSFKQDQVARWVRWSDEESFQAIGDKMQPQLSGRQVNRIAESIFTLVDLPRTKFLFRDLRMALLQAELVQREVVRELRRNVS